MGGDDGEQLIFAQYFDWGYAVRNPPLYTWLVIAAQKLFGVSAFAVNAVKFTLLWLLYFFLYRAGILLFNDKRFAILAALSPLLIFHITWDSLLGFSHSVLAAMLYVATLYALLRLEHHNNIFSYAGLGLVIGLGILSKYAFLFFLLALITAAFCDTNLRHRLLHPKILITLMAAAVVTAPHLSWLLEHLDAMADEITPALSSQEATEHLLSAGKGILSGMKAAVGFLLSLLLFLDHFLPGRLPPSQRSR